jgi:AraC-like DNA-binding protein
VFSARDLAAPIVLADASLRPYTRAFLRTVVDPRAPAATSGLREVADTVELLLPLGRSSMTQVARYLGLTPGGLRRSLTEHGETFSSVVHATRARLAERYLPNARYSLTEVSRLLGFQAPSAFSRWFRQQFGRSPTEWRQAVRAPVPEDGGTVREG